MKKRNVTSNTTNDPDKLKAGYIRDYISGQPVKETPEETEAVQVFTRRLVEDYSYPKEHIQTRPQHRVRKRSLRRGKVLPRRHCYLSVVKEDRGRSVHGCRMQEEKP